MRSHVVEDALEALVGRTLRAVQPVINTPNLLEHMGVVRDEVAHHDEGVHNAYAHVDCRVAAQDGG